MESKCPFSEYEHSVMPSLDYPFATSFYPPDDPRYALKQEFERLLWHHKKIRAYNCKFQTPKLAHTVYNVYIYLYDRVKVMGKHYSHILSNNQDFIDLFYKALECFPLEEAMNKRIQVFLEDYTICSKSYSITKSAEELRTVLTYNYSSIFTSINYSGTWLYVFFTAKGYSEIRKNTLHKKKLRKICYQIIKKHDLDNVWNVNEFHIRIDSQEHYDQYGVQHYFNSDAMIENTYI